MSHAVAVLAVALTLSACSAPGDDPLDAEDARFPDGKADGALDPGSTEARAVLVLVNDAQVSADELDIDARLHAWAADNIVAARPFGTLAELDAVAWVGPVALQRLVDYARQNGLVPPRVEWSAIFSPQRYEDSHNARVVELIDGAQHSIDVAMYSFSDFDISAALEDAVDRGVAVRFLFDTAYEDRRLSGSELAGSRSGRLESIGVDVRYVNKTLHHKFAIIDGPVDDLSRASTATIVSGSGNWSNSAATYYDESTFFITGSGELALRFQRELELLWDHSRDLAAEPDVAVPGSDLVITDADLRDAPGVDLYLTSANFSVGSDGVTFRVDRDLTHVADQWVAAIEGATESIWIASGHLRLRSVAEALVAKKAAHPELDIRVYVDQQEYVSVDEEIEQIAAREECLAEATTPSQVFDCEQRSYLYAKELADAGIALRHKTYAYRWHLYYAAQMHNKYMLVDGDELLAGSYNLSINAEHQSFENTVHLRGAEHQALVDQFEQNFERMWTTGDGLLEPLRTEIATASRIPLVFAPMALSWDQVTDLRDLIRAQCPEVDSEPFTTRPYDYRDCWR